MLEESKVMKEILYFKRANFAWPLAFKAYHWLCISREKIVTCIRSKLSYHETFYRLDPNFNHLMSNSSFAKTTGKRYWDTI